MLTVKANEWYETIRMADNVTLIHEPWIKPFFRCNMWHVRGRDRAPSFRPLIGCVPAQGGGRRSPTAYHAFPPVKPTVRQVKTVRVRPGATTSAVARCPEAQRFVSATHAVAFYGSIPPTAAVVKAVTVRQRVAAGVVKLRIRATRAIAQTPTIVQLDLLCVPR